MGENVAEYMATRERQREAGIALDRVLEQRRGMAETSRAMTAQWVTDEQRDAILAEYTRKCAELSAQAGRLRWQISVLDHELDDLAGVNARGCYESGEPARSS